MTRVESLVPLMHYDPDKSWITDLHLDHPKGMQPQEVAFMDLLHIWERSYFPGFSVTGCLQTDIKCLASSHENNQKHQNHIMLLVHKDGISAKFTFN